MINGTIKFFNAGKGFGFITPDGGGGDIFLPAATMSAAGLSTLKTGQRVLFEQAPDVKGPKAVKLQLAAEQPVPAPAPQGGRITVYCDPASDNSAEILETIAALGYQPQPVDYIAAPPGHDVLRRLSALLRGTDQSLVRRYDPLFLELQLDDRFITETEFWTAIAEHPALINGPVLVFAGKARICQSPDEARAFLGKGSDIAPKPKKLSPRIAALLRGEPLPPDPMEEGEEMEEGVADGTAGTVPGEKAPKPRKAAAARAAPGRKAKAPAAQPAKVKKKAPARAAPAKAAKKKAPARAKKK